MKLLHVLPSYLPAFRYGGPIYSVHGLCKGLVNLGHDVHVFTTNVDGQSDSDVPLGQRVDIDGVQVWYFRARYFRRLYYSPSMKRALKREIRNFDLVHLHSIFLWPTWMAARAARENNIPYVVSPRGMLVRDLIERKSRFLKSAWLGLIEKENIEKASAIHVTSRVEEQEVLKFGYRFPPFVVIPNGIDTDFLKEDEPSSSPLTEQILLNGAYILFLGRINWKKGLDRLIKALPYINNIQLVIAGNDDEGYRRKLDNIAKEYGVERRIFFAGPVYGDEKMTLIKKASAFVLPSYSENFGMAVLEAMAIGCPVVVTPEVGLAPTVSTICPELVLNGNPVDIGKGLNYLLSDSTRLKHIGLKGKNVVSTSFAWEAVTPRMEKVYCNLINRGNPSTS